MITLYGHIYQNGRRFIAETKRGQLADSDFATYGAAEHWLKMDDEIVESQRHRRGQ